MKTVQSADKLGSQRTFKWVHQGGKMNHLITSNMKDGHVYERDGGLSIIILEIRN